MGYRHYFYKVKKEDVGKIRKLNADVFHDEDLFKQERIFEFGKLYYDDTAERIYSKGVPLFTDKEKQERLEDYRPFVVGKEGLLEAIEIYKEKVGNYYKGLLKDGAIQVLPFGIEIQREDIKSIDKVIEHIKAKITEVDCYGIVNIDEDSKWTLTNSWTYEYEIFELVHILKTVDWEKDTILFYGY